MSDKRRAVNIKRDDHAAAGRKIQDYIAHNPNIFGGADIFNLDFGTPITRAGMLASVLTGLFDEERRPAVRQWVVIAPPGTDGATAVEAALAQFRDSFQALVERELQSKELEALKSRFNVIVANDRRHRSVLDLIDAQPERTAVIVMEAAGYRDDRVGPYIAPGSEGPLRPEDFWAPQLHALASAATRQACENRLYVALDADELSPRRQALADLLLTIEGCGVMGSSRDDDPETILAEHVDRWDTWIREGRLGKALQDVDTLPASLERQKDYLRIQLLYRAGHLEQALRAIRERLEIGPDLDPSARVKLARMAADANASLLAHQLLAPIIDALESREDLESALATTSNAGLDDLEKRAAARLEALFPGTASLQRRRLERLMRNHDYVGAAKLAREELADEMSAAFFDRLSRHLSSHDVPDYLALIAEAGSDDALAEAYRIASANDALVRKLAMQAFELLRPLPSTPRHAGRGERMLLKTLEAVFLDSNKDEGWAVGPDLVQAAVIDLIERLASNPANQALRAGLIRIMQPEVAGTKGLALMAASALQLASRPIRLRKGGKRSQAGMEWLFEHQPFLTAAFRWMASEEPLVIGRSVLPVELLTESADEAVSAVFNYLSYAPLVASDDTSAMLTWLAFGASVAPHSGDPDFDLRLIRLFAGKLASAGEFQQARDLAEHALMYCSATARRRRLGWFAMADVYARTGDPIEALLAIACTLAADDGGDEEDIYQEITGVARLFRNCGLHDLARPAIDKARELLHRMNLYDLNAHQLDTLELQLRQTELQAAGDDDAALAALLVDVVANGKDVLKHNGNTAPTGVLLGQLMRTAQLRGLAVPVDAEATLNELQKHARGLFGELLATMSAVRPEVKQIFAMVSSLGTARYSDDVGFDMRNLAIVAGRALAGDDILADAEATAFVLDLLADRGVAVPGWDEAAVPAPAPVSITETAEIARAVSRSGLNVLQAGFDENGHLVRLATIADELGEPVREPADVILQERLNHWATKFPYAYGIDEDSANLFYTTTAALRLSALPDGPVVVAADASLQVFPPNLLFIDGEFAGRTRPMAATPSLAWLGRARETAITGDGRLCAWISTAVGGGSQTLPMIAERLQPTFEDHGFVVDHGQVLPGTFAGATLAVVTAHGGVHPEGRYFQVVSDEGILRITAADLANALRNVGVVVLFVCSGGRADKHPAANTTLGLAKQILDRGCSAVIASPWPLDARVPSHWLPTFLDRWTSGATLIEANFQANKVVDGRFSQDPARGLAMTVFGNPELKLVSRRSGMNATERSS